MMISAFLGCRRVNSLWWVELAADHPDTETEARHRQQRVASTFCPIRFPAWIHKEAPDVVVSKHAVKINAPGARTAASGGSR